VNLTIDLPENETLALKAKAQARGLSAEQYARQVLEHDLAPDWLRESWAEAQRNGTDQLSMDEIDAEITAARTARREQPPQPGA
jgi:plasmid stability protein